MDKEEKKDIKMRLKRYLHVMEGYSVDMHGRMLKMESKRYYEDHFTPEERKYVKYHCPIIIRMKLKIIGANIF